MTSLRRFGALLSSLLLMQLTLLSSGWPCPTHGSAGAHDGAPAAMSAHASHAVTRGQSSHDGCDSERLTGDCKTMPSCATALTLPASLGANVALATSTATLTEPVSIRSELAVAPDAPPPRG